MSLETLEQKLNQIDADTAAKLANDAPTIIQTETIPAEPNPEKDGTPIVAAETLIPNNETVIDAEATVTETVVENQTPSEPVVETPVVANTVTETPVVENQTPSEPVAQTSVAPSPVSIPVPRSTEVRSVNLIFPEGNFSKAEVQNLNKIEYVTASGIVNLLEAQGVVKSVGKKQGLGRGKSTILYAFN